ncbi:MAG: chemotaxis protein CheZ [Azospirillum sp.]|nr:chemotaxis protein CheZ [Azospirillum sp.]
MAPFAPTGPDKQLWQRLDRAHTEATTPLARDEVAAIVHEIIANMAGDVSATDLKLYNELEALARYIQHAKAEIAAINPDDIRSNHIPTATDELDAVVGATEKATNTIMDGCDVIGGLAAQVPPEIGQKLTEVVTGIYEACNFQDVTGQRITKVVRALKHIESKIDALVVAFGEQVGASAPTPSTQPLAAAPGAAAGGDPDGYLLHGPSLPGQAIDQDEIDRLLASFD